jgi:hypothetical protein
MQEALVHHVESFHLEFEMPHLITGPRFCLSLYCSRRDIDADTLVASSLAFVIRPSSPPPAQSETGGKQTPFRVGFKWFNLEWVFRSQFVLCSIRVDIFQSAL